MEIDLLELRIDNVSLIAVQRRTSESFAASLFVAAEIFHQ